MAKIPINQRKDGLKIEDRWWRTYYPSTYNDNPPNGTTFIQGSNKSKDDQVAKKMASMTKTQWLNTIGKTKIGLTILELITGFNKFNKGMSQQRRDKVLQAIKKKCIHHQWKNIRSRYTLKIPLQTKAQMKKIRERINRLHKNINCPAPIKEFINHNTCISFLPTKRVIDATRMDRSCTNDITFKDIQTSTLTEPQPCNCKNIHNTRKNKTGHTYVRTDNPQDIDNLLNDYPDLREFKHILTTSFQNRISPDITTTHKKIKANLSRFLKSIPGVKGLGKAFCKDICHILQGSKQMTKDTNVGQNMTRHQETRSINASDCKRLKET